MSALYWYKLSSILFNFWTLPCKFDVPIIKLFIALIIQVRFVLAGRLDSILARSVFIIKIKIFVFLV